MAMAGTAALVVILLVVGGLYLLTGNKKNDHNVASQPSAQAPVQWKPITNAPIARDAAATTQTDGTIWIFGGIRADGRQGIGDAEDRERHGSPAISSAASASVASARKRAPVMPQSKHS